MLGFNQDGTPQVPQFAQNGIPVQAPVMAPPATPQLDPNVQAMLTQNQQLQQQLAQIAVGMQQQNTPQAPQAPQQPTDLNVNEIYDPNTESGKWYQANEQFKQQQLMSGVQNMIQTSVGQFTETQKQEQQLTDYFRVNNVPLEHQANFRQFLDNPVGTDYNTLFQVYATKNKLTTPTPTAPAVPGVPPAIAKAAADAMIQAVPTPGEIPRTYNAPVPVAPTIAPAPAPAPVPQSIATVNSPADGQIVPPPTLLQVAKQIGAK